MISFLKNIFNKYVGDNHYKKNVLIMVGGRVLAQAIPILLTPLLSRIYSPEEFGIFAVYLTITSFIAMISNGRYCLAILLPKEKQNAQKLVSISAILTVITTTFFSIILLFSGDFLFTVLNVPVLSNYVLLILLNILFIGLHEALFYYGLREKKYKFLALTINLQALGMISTRLLLGYLGYTGLGLMFSYLLGYFLSFVLLASKFKIPLRQQLQNLNLKILIKKYINFPRFSLVADSLSVLTNMAPNLLLNKMFGSTTTGYFSMSEKILGAPLWFVTSSVGDVFKQEASEQYRLTGSCRKIFEKTSKSLFFLGIIPFILIFLIVPSLIPFILGEVWAPVGDYIRIFSLMYFSSFVVNPISYIVYIVNKQNYGILFQTIKAISIVLAFVLGLYYNNLQLTLILWSALIILSNVLVFVLSYKLARNCKYVGPTQENN